MKHLFPLNVSMWVFLKMPNTHFLALVILIILLDSRVLA